VSVRRYYTIEDLAEVAGVSRYTIKSWVTAGVLPHALPNKERPSGVAYAYSDEHMTILRQLLAIRAQNKTLLHIAVLLDQQKESRVS